MAAGKLKCISDIGQMIATHGDIGWTSDAAEQNQ